jgi:hypothetical protein
MGTLLEERFSNFTALGNEPEAMITEPNIITCEFVTGCAVHAGDHAVQIYRLDLRAAAWRGSYGAPHRCALCDANRSRAGSQV